MAHVELDGDVIRVTAEYREKELIKQVPGSRWKVAEHSWFVPLSWATCCSLRGVFGQDLTVGPLLNEWARGELIYRVAPSLAAREASDSEGNPELYAFQRAGVTFLKLAGSALLADEMGTGKTIQAIQALVELDAWPALVVCPNSMKHTWRKEIERWAPQVTPIVIEGSAAARRKLIELLKEISVGDYAAAIINWEGLRAHTRLAGYGSIRLSDEEKERRELNEIPWAAVVADEAHRGKDPSAKQTRALWGVSRDAPHRLALTGTPVANAPTDLWSIMHFVAPEEWPAKTKFIDRYCMLSWGYGGGMDVVGLKSETREELFKFLDPRFLRRPKEAVLPQLPAKTYAKRYVDLGQKQRRAYDQLRKELLAELDSGVLVATHPLTRMIRLLQFASAYGEIQGDGSLLLTEPSSKVDALEEVVDELGGKPAVVFAYSRQLIELAHARLTKLGYTTGLITGSVDVTLRQSYVESFQAGNIQLMLATLGAGGEGITLTAADTAIFLQRSFSSVQNSQAEDRVHRIGQAGAVTIVDLVGTDTVEERVHEVLLEKGERLEEIARDEATLRMWLER